MCDEGRFGFGYHHDPLACGWLLRREAQVQVEAPLDDLVTRVAEEIRRIVRAHGEGAIGCIVLRATTEEMFLVRCFFRDVLRHPTLDHRVRSVQVEAADASEDGPATNGQDGKQPGRARHRPLAWAGRIGHAGQ
jgi:predicted molibdopterin-dependent oxidoreductase YjgC